MRTKLAFSLLSVALLLVITAPDSQGQGKRGFGGGFPGGGFPGGGFPGGSPRDPNVIFDFLAKGRGYFLAAESRRSGEALNQFLMSKGVNNGQVTRELFAAFNDQRANSSGARADSDLRG